MNIHAKCYYRPTLWIQLYKRFLGPFVKSQKTCQIAATKLIRDYSPFRVYLTFCHRNAIKRYFAYCPNKLPTLTHQDRAFWEPLEERNFGEGCKENMKRVALIIVFSFFFKFCFEWFEIHLKSKIFFAWHWNNMVPDSLYIFWILLTPLEQRAYFTRVLWNLGILRSKRIILT